MAEHALLEQLDSCLSAALPAREVQLSGHWSTSSRRTYATEAASRSGSETFVEVLDRRWHGTLTSDRRLGAIAFLLHGGDLHWAKSPEIASTLSVEVSLHSYLDFQADRATLACSVGGGRLPGVPISLPAASIISDAVVTSGRVTALARVPDAVLFVILLPGELLGMGRKRVWHVRDNTPFDAAPEIRQFMTRGRTGTILANSGGTARDGR